MKKRNVLLNLIVLLVIAFAVKVNVSAQETEVPEGYTGIYTASDLCEIRNNTSGNYILMKDIDLSCVTNQGGDLDTGMGWVPIPTFAGVLDGNGYRITGMNIYGTSGYGVGLISQLTGGKVRNLAMKDVTINVSSPCVGSIAGTIAGGCIEECYSSGQITNVYSGEEISNTGGIAGYIESGNNSLVRNCINMVTIVSEKGTASGIVGKNCSSDSIIHCYSCGEVKGKNSYGISDFGNKDGENYYLEENVEQSDCIDGITPLTSDQMQDSQYFTGFDFYNTWEMERFCAYTYPQLKVNRYIRVEAIEWGSYPPTKLVYQQGEMLDVSNVSIRLYYEDGSCAVTCPPREEMLSKYDMNIIGIQTIFISRGDKTLSFDIEVKEQEKEENEENDESADKITWDYTIMNDGNIKISGTIWSDSDGIITIPDTIDGKKVTQMGSIDVENENVIKEIIFPSSITSIASDAFYGCKYLEKIEIPFSITDIGEYAFFNCSSLKEVEIFSDSIKIGTGCFGKCASLSKVIIHSKNLVIDGSYDEGIFCGTSLFTAGPIGSGSDYEFAWDKEIPAYAFADSEIEEIIFPKTVEIIGKNAFAYCDKLKKITLPEKIKEISSGVFRGSGISDITFSNKLEKIGASAFRECQDLKSITLPDGLIEMEESVFNRCKNLEKVILPESLQTMNHWTFNSCDKLKTVGPIGSGCNIEYKWKKRIPSNAFNSWFVLSSIIIDDGISEIGTYAFVPDYLNSKQVVIPNSVTKIEKCGIGYVSASTSTIEKKIRSFTIYGDTGNEAEKYAQLNGFQFVDLTGSNKEENTGSASTGSNTKENTNLTTGNIVVKNNKVKVQGTKITKVTALKNRKIRLKYKGVKNISGYQIQYSMKKNFTKAKLKSTRKTTQTITGLKKGKKYYIRVRVFSKKKGKTYYSPWSNKKTVKIKK